jgi:hypothetical protein
VARAVPRGDGYRYPRLVVGIAGFDDLAFSVQLHVQEVLSWGNAGDVNPLAVQIVCVGISPSHGNTLRGTVEASSASHAPVCDARSIEHAISLFPSVLHHCTSVGRQEGVVGVVHKMVVAVTRGPRENIGTGTRRWKGNFVSSLIGSQNGEPQHPPKAGSQNASFSNCT